MTRPYSRFRSLAQAFGLFAERRDAATLVEMRVPVRYDALTGVRTRAALIEAVENLEVDPAIASTLETTVLVIDLDRLRAINEVHSRAAGDRVLATIADRLRGVIEPAGIIGRLAGDEFGCVLHHPVGSDLPIRTAGAILGAVAAPIEVRGGVVVLHVAIGIAGGAGRARASGRILASAKAAASQGKRPGKSTCAIYDPRLDAETRARAALDLEMRDGFARGEFQPEYRPITNPRTGAAGGFACAAVWHHPQRGAVPAEAFLPAARASGLLPVLGLALLQRACAEADAWPRHQILSFDTAALKLDAPKFAESVLRILLATELNPKRLSLEVPRTALIGNRSAARAALLALSGAGVQITLDDLGIPADTRPTPPIFPARPAGWRRPVANDQGPFAVRARG